MRSICGENRCANSLFLWPTTPKNTAANIPLLTGRGVTDSKLNYWPGWMDGWIWTAIIAVCFNIITTPRLLVGLFSPRHLTEIESVGLCETEKTAEEIKSAEVHPSIHPSHSIHPSIEQLLLLQPSIHPARITRYFLIASEAFATGDETTTNHAAAATLAHLLTLWCSWWKTFFSRSLFLPDSILMRLM